MKKAHFTTLGKSYLSIQLHLRNILCRIPFLSLLSMYTLLLIFSPSLLPSQITSISSQNQFSIVDCMGKPLISFGDSEVYLVHCGTRSCKIVGCPVSERRHRVLSAQRKAIMQEDLHRSFAFTAIRASEQEAKAASNIQLSQEVMRLYVHR